MAPTTTTVSRDRLDKSEREVVAESLPPAPPPGAPAHHASPSPKPASSPTSFADSDSSGYAAGKGLSALGGFGGGGALEGAPVGASRGPALMPAYRAAPSYPAASIAAGEWNDNANYHEFQKWLVTEKSLPFRPVDVSHRRFLVVRDEAGRAVPGCHVAVSDAGEHSRRRSSTGPSGRALLFPVRRGARRGARDGDRHMRGVERHDGPYRWRTPTALVDLRLPVVRSLPQSRTIDVAFILDTTGSMSEEIASVKSTIAKVAAGLGRGERERSDRPGRVQGPRRCVRHARSPLRDATRRGSPQSVAGISAGGGGDTPESVNEGIHVALTGLDWQTQSVGRFAFLVGDAPPHLDYQQDFSYAADMKTASHRGIRDLHHRRERDGWARPGRVAPDRAVHERARTCSSSAAARGRSRSAAATRSRAAAGRRRTTRAATSTRSSSGRSTRRARRDRGGPAARRGAERGREHEAVRSADRDEAVARLRVVLPHL